MSGTEPEYLACAGRDGRIVIREACPPGMVPLFRDVSRRRLEIIVCRASRRVRDNHVVVPGLTAEVSDETANLMVQEFREALVEQFAEARLRSHCCGRARA